MTATRLGAILWLACAQFFLAEQIARSAWTAPYSFTTNYVSDLGATTAPWHTLMNGSFMLQGLLIAGGALLTRPNRIARSLLVASGGGVIVVGLAPENADGPLHYWGAALHFLCGSLAMIVIGLSLRQRFGWASLTTGMTVLAAIIVLALPDPTWKNLLGVGSVERVAAYGIAGWMVALGIWSLSANSKNAPA